MVRAQPHSRRQRNLRNAQARALDFSNHHATMCSLERAQPPSNHMKQLTHHPPSFHRPASTDLLVHNQATSPPSIDHFTQPTPTSSLKRAENRTVPYSHLAFSLSQSENFCTYIDVQNSIRFLFRRRTGFCSTIWQLTTLIRRNLSSCVGLALIVDPHRILPSQWHRRMSTGQMHQKSATRNWFMKDDNLGQFMASHPLSVYMALGVLNLSERALL